MAEKKRMQEMFTTHRPIRVPYCASEFYETGFRAARRVNSDGTFLHKTHKEAYTEMLETHPRKGYSDTRQAQDFLFEKGGLSFTIGELGFLCRSKMLEHYRVPETKNGRIYILDKSMLAMIANHQKEL